MSQGQNPSRSDTHNKIEGGNSSKKIHRDDSSSNPPGQFQDEGQGQGSNVEEGPIKNLPPEMLMEILKCMDTRTLFTLRLVNWNWNSISTGILCHRPDAQICFEFMNKNKFVWRKCGRVDVDVDVEQRDKELKDLVGCVKKSKNFPFAHFAFSVSVFSDPSKFFNHPDFAHLFSCFSASESSSSQNGNPQPNQRIKGLDFKFCLLGDVDSLKFLAAKCRDLLQNKTPFVENLSLDFQCLNFVPNPENLIRSLNQNRAEINAQQIQVQFPIEPEFQLTHLKTLRFKCDRISDHSKILLQFLSAAVNLEKIFLHEPEHREHLPIVLANFDFLKSLGKFHLLKNFDFDVNAQRLSQLRERPDFTRALFNLELEELILGKTREKLSASDNTNATSFISALFDSSKKSLKKLEMGQLGTLTTLQFPTFKHLTELKLKQGADSNQKFFPRGVRSLDIFPAVRDLHLPENLWVYFGSLDSTPVLPNVRSLSVVDMGFIGSCISVLNLLCPNLKHLKIYKGNYHSSILPQLNFLPVGREIWRLMTGLESLEVDTNIYSTGNPSAQFDSCFTGISVENVQRLYQMRRAKSAARLTPEREHASILDMKSLTKLTLNHYEPCGWSKKKSGFRGGKWTWVQQEFAFKLMPNLQTQFNLKSC